MKKTTLTMMLVLFPFTALAATANVDGTFSYIMSLAKTVTGLLSSLIIVFFFWTLIKFIKDSQSGATTLEKSKNALIWSVVAVFFSVGVWSVVGYVQKSFFGGAPTSDITETPSLPTID